MYLKKIYFSKFIFFFIYVRKCKILVVFNFGRGLLILGIKLVLYYVVFYYRVFKKKKDVIIMDIKDFKLMVIK